MILEILVVTLVAC